MRQAVKIFNGQLIALNDEANPNPSPNPNPNPNPKLKEKDTVVALILKEGKKTLREEPANPNPNPNPNLRSKGSTGRG